MTVDMNFGFVPSDPVCFDKLSHLWLVNMGMVVRRGRPVEQVCNQKGTRWYENHAVRFRQSGSQNRKSSQEIRCDQRRLVVSDDTAGKGVPTLPTWLQEEYMVQEESPSLSICLFFYLSNLQQTVCPFRE